MEQTSERIMTLAVDAMEEKKAMQIVTLDLVEISMVADCFVICHGNSEVHVQAIATEVKKKSEASGITVKSVEGFDSARWVLIDLGDVVVHVFHRDEREYYNIERLWSDAKVVEHA